MHVHDPSIQGLGFGIARSCPEYLGARIEQLRMVRSNCKPALCTLERLLYEPAVQLRLRKSGDGHGLVRPGAVGQQQEPQRLGGVAFFGKHQAMRMERRPVGRKLLHQYGGNAVRTFKLAGFAKILCVCQLFVGSLQCFSPH